MPRWSTKSKLMHTIASPGMGLADAVRKTATLRSIDNADTPESQIPIDLRLPLRGSYLSGFTYACRRPKLGRSGKSPLEEARATSCRSAPLTPSSTMRPFQILSILLDEGSGLSNLHSAIGIDRIGSAKTGKNFPSFPRQPIRSVQAVLRWRPSAFATARSACAPRFRCGTGQCPERLRVRLRSACLSCRAPQA